MSTNEQGQVLRFAGTNQDLTLNALAGTNQDLTLNALNAQNVSVLYDEERHRPMLLIQPSNA